MDDAGGRAAAGVAVDLSVVIPVRNEAGNVEQLAAEIRASLAERCRFEIIFVDDASTDRTVQRIRVLRHDAMPEVRLLCHAARCGQSIAVRNGVRAARADWIVTLDGDGQNDPADIPMLLEMLVQGGEGLKLIAGNRRRRQDSWVRRVSSRIANGVRRRVLHDDTPDAGCGIKLFHRATFLELPVFDHMHRFLPALFRRAGVRTTSVAVNHRQRMCGESKYGISNRLWVGIVDLFGVRWLIGRAPRLTQLKEE